MLLPAGVGTAESEINSFIKGKKVIDIKMVNTNEVNREGHPIIAVLIMYREIIPHPLEELKEKSQERARQGYA